MKKPAHNHRRNQLIITIGVVFASTITLVHPEWYLHGAIINIITNAYWVWEDVI